MARAKGLPKLQRAPASLAGRVASELETVRWVASQIDVAKPNPEECPAPFAWTLLCQCREDSEFTKWFVEKLWSKLIPSRTQLETTAPKDLDGKVQIELIERIQAMSNKAKKKTEKKPEKKAPPPSAFDALDEEKK